MPTELCTRRKRKSSMGLGFLCSYMFLIHLYWLSHLRQEVEVPAEDSARTYWHFESKRHPIPCHCRRTASSFCMGVCKTEESPMPSPECDEAEAEEESGLSLPSVGSAHHKLGSCQPCAWFWKPQGCLNGAACLRCHLCPAGEIKRRKGELKQKKAQAAEGASIDDAATELCDGGPTVPPPSSAPCLNLTEQGLPPAPSWTASDAIDALPSIGSRLHGSGQCKPCAWFWKAEGCRNEAACGHCHLCPLGEAKARKQAKLAMIRAKAQEGENELKPEVNGQLGTGALPLGGSEVRPIVLTPAPALLFNVCEVAHHQSNPAQLQSLSFFPGQPMQSTPVQPPQQVQVHVQPQCHQAPVPSIPPAPPVPQYCSAQIGQHQNLQRPVLLGNPLPAFQPAQSIGGLRSRSGPDGLKCVPYEAGERRHLPQEMPLGILPSVPLYHQPVHPPMQALPAALPSVGSALHAEGKCSPCAWFWKPQGCRHGAGCGRCHLCPAGEIKQRKKSKASKDVATDPLPPGCSCIILALLISTHVFFFFFFFLLSPRSTR